MFFCRLGRATGAPRSATGFSRRVSRCSRSRLRRPKPPEAKAVSRKVLQPLQAFKDDAISFVGKLCNTTVVFRDVFCTYIHVTKEMCTSKNACTAVPRVLNGAISSKPLRGAQVETGTPKNYKAIDLLPRFPVTSKFRRPGASFEKGNCGNGVFQDSVFFFRHEVKGSPLQNVHRQGDGVDVFHV